MLSALRPTRRHLLSALAALTLGLSSAHADTTIKLMVGFPPGGGTDAIARLFSDKLKDLLGANTEAVGIDHYGASADAKTLFKEFGITADAAVEKAKALIG